jgi:hypothetical protein
MLHCKMLALKIRVSGGSIPALATIKVRFGRHRLHLICLLRIFVAIGYGAVWLIHTQFILVGWILHDG